MAVAYSAYAADGAKPRYGCDFTALDTFDFWRGLYLPAITHAMCNRASVDLPKAHWTTDHTLPVLHTISTHPDTPSGDKIAAYRKTLQSRLRRLPQGDGIGMVHAEMTPHWTDADRDVCQVAGDVLATL